MCMIITVATFIIIANCTIHLAFRDQNNVNINQIWPNPGGLSFMIVIHVGLFMTPDLYP